MRILNQGQFPKHISSQNRPDQLCGPPSIHSMRTGFIFRGKNGRGVKFTIHLHLVPSLRKSSAVSLRPIYALVDTEKYYSHL
jgi:hypothetical protein